MSHKGKIHSIGRTPGPDYPQVRKQKGKVSPKPQFSVVNHSAAERMSAEEREARLRAHLPSGGDVMVEQLPVYDAPATDTTKRWAATDDDDEPRVTVNVANSVMRMMHAVTGNPAFMAPNLRPVARVQVSSSKTIAYYTNASTALFSTFVCDPTGIASNSLGVTGWSTRFAGFQQYRVRKTEWHIIPTRVNIGTTTSSQLSGWIGYWIEDSPQTGAPVTSDFQKANVKVIMANCDHQTVHTMETNEPQDLNLSDIFVPPSHVTGSVIQQGQHCLQLYGDSTNTALVSGGANAAMFGVFCIYDIEFFGVGGV